MTVKVLLTHDIDYPIHGPSKKHILKRIDRFPREVIGRVLSDNYNPYYGIPDMLALEEKHKVRSTFFFRPSYDDYSSVDNYRQIMQELVKGGWEIGVHINEADLLSSVIHEKSMVENACGVKVNGSRVHYLKIRDTDISSLGNASLKYDSSLCYGKSSLDWRNFGYYHFGNVVVFPITLMDAYMFTYMQLREHQVLSVVKEAVAMADRTEKKLMTLLWHDSCLQMYGGRAYKDVLAWLAENTEIVRGIDALEMVKSQKIAA